jgi:hypothetical protein
LFLGIVFWNEALEGWKLGSIRNGRQLKKNCTIQVAGLQ